jgi:hypothetical protein
MSAVHWVASLERDNLGPAEFVEVQTKLRRGITESYIVVVHEAVDGLDLTTNVKVTGSLV